MSDTVAKWLEKNFKEDIQIRILQDNKYLIEEKYFKKDDFIRCLNAYEFHLNGIGMREFYILLNNDELQDFTIQITDFEFDSNLNFK